MSIFGKNIGISEQLRAELRIFFTVLIGSMFFISDIVFAGCGFVDVRSFSPSKTNKFIDGGYKGFLDLSGKNVADCYATILENNSRSGVQLLANLNSNKVPPEIDDLRGLSPKIKLLVAHRGGPDWANGIPDNSVEAFNQSIGMGVTSVEVDMQMDSHRNLIAYHDTSFADMVKSAPELNLQNATTLAISASEWIPAGQDKTLDDSKLGQLSRVIPNSFSFKNTEAGVTSLRLQPGATVSSTAKVSSLDNILKTIQDASERKFKTRTAVNIFIDAAKSKDITIATINKLRRYKLMEENKIFNNTKYSIPSISSIAIQFRVKDFPLGAADLKRALCTSAENSVRYIKHVKVVRSLYFNYGFYRTYTETTTTSYEDSNDWKKIYRETTTSKYVNSFSYLKTGTISQNDYPIQLWGDAASGTCDIDNSFKSSGIALVPVLEEVLPYGVTIDSQGKPRNFTSATEAVSAIRDYLNPYKNDFNIGVIEFSYTPMDMFSYYTSVDQKTPYNTNFDSMSVYKEFADKVTDAVTGKKYIYQSFNRFFDITFAGPTGSPYLGQYLCSSEILNLNLPQYGYVCKTQVAASTDEQKFEYRSKPGFYTGICNYKDDSPFKSLPFGLTTTDNPLLETYLNNPDFIGYADQRVDFCTVSNVDNRMSDYTMRYKSFVGNPSFRLYGGI